MQQAKPNKASEVPECPSCKVEKNLLEKRVLCLEKQLNERTVVQKWVTQYCTWKEQTVLFCAMRGPDAGGSGFVKLVTRWLRSVVLKNAAPHKTFMGDTNFLRISEIADHDPLCLDMLPVHFLGHLMHAMQVVGLRHPEWEAKGRAWEAYSDLCNFLHINPETVQQMNMRLKDEPAD